MKGPIAKIARFTDAFAKPPTLYYRGQTKIVTLTGCVCSILIAMVMLAFTLTDLLVGQPTYASQMHTLVMDKGYSFNPFKDAAVELSFGVQAPPG